MIPSIISYDSAIDLVTWTGAIEALRAGHRMPKARVGDLFLGPSDATLLNRAAYIEGVGYGVKAVTVFDQNPAAGLETVQGAMLVFEPDHGCVSAVIDSRLVTELKTAGDSVLGAQLLARPDSRHLLIVGAGTVAANLIKAYVEGFPALEKISVWARRYEKAEALVEAMRALPLDVDIVAVPDLADAVAQADIVSTATMARDPILKGEWVTPGTHVDLIGAFKADMREADDALIASSSLFVDSRETTIRHIGELKIPIEAGVISAESVKGDLYDLVQGKPARQSADEITVYKNGGGAHLDTMIAIYISKVMKASI
ncbi:ornithine cyclodeaminase [Marinobacterium zhoushanense]|uniref:Ornithine cyclodeaminase n=1 Tax=Marinobacterium zhoushanense TaxID=1679163 RepID=A0ABQ1KHH7_9GAMM|nr:ornithine cyclodeaminase [Marinobacterium zhoushanense]GGB94647.1 ornithine cyclodeaminase [Marinobacterium zhoushanense]